MEKEEKREIKRGQIYYCDFGCNSGSVQCGVRPALVLQANNFNRNAPTVIVAAVTSVIKKKCMPSHIVLPDDCGLPKKSMVMLEQVRTVNRSELSGYAGCVSDGDTLRVIGNNLKKVLGLWHRENDRDGMIMTLCKNCLDEYRRVPETIVHRLDPFQKAKEACTKCNRPGYDYIIFHKRKAKKENCG